VARCSPIAKPTPALKAVKLVTQSQSPMPKLRVTAPTVGEALIVGKRGGTMIGMVAERFWRGCAEA
jgi:hypothetical protein